MFDGDQFLSSDDPFRRSFQSWLFKLVDFRLNRKENLVAAYSFTLHNTRREENENTVDEKNAVCSKSS